jgi:hypothetical protein
MAGLLAAAGVSVLNLMYGWRRAAGGPRERLFAVRWIAAGIGGTLAVLAIIVAVGPWLSYVVVPLFMLALGPYLARLPEGQPTTGHINWRRTGKFWIIMAILLLLLDAWVLLGGVRT